MTSYPIEKVLVVLCPVTSVTWSPEMYRRVLADEKFSLGWNEFEKILYPFDDLRCIAFVIFSLSP